MCWNAAIEYIQYLQKKYTEEESELQKLRNEVDALRIMRSFA